MVTRYMALWVGVLGIVSACGEIDEAAGPGTSTSTATSTGSTGTTAAGSGTTGGTAADTGSSGSTAAVDGTTTGASGSSETGSPPPAVQCDWIGQPNSDREWGHCTPKLTWEDAEAACVGEGGHLVSFASASDNLFAINVVPAGTEAWIGLDDRATADVYEWTDGTPYGYMNWEDGQPDSPDDRCVAIGTTQRWFDYSCDDARVFVCVRPL